MAQRKAVSIIYTAAVQQIHMKYYGGMARAITDAGSSVSARIALWSVSRASKIISGKGHLTYGRQYAAQERPLTGAAAGEEKAMMANARLARLHDPDPYYIRYYLVKYMDAADAAIGRIFASAGSSFGVMMRGRAKTRDEYVHCLWQREKSNGSSQGTDMLAREFLRWYDAQHAGAWHEGTPAQMMGIVLDARHATGSMPGIKIMIRAKERHKGDPIYEINTRGLLSGGKLLSRQELEMRVKRRMPAFLEIINHKRSQNGEPAVKTGDVMPSAFAEITRHDDIRQRMHENPKGKAKANQHKQQPSQKSSLQLLSNVPARPESNLQGSAQHYGNHHVSMPLYMPIADAAEAYARTVNMMCLESEARIREMISKNTIASTVSIRQSQISGAAS